MMLGTMRRKRYLNEYIQDAFCYAIPNSEFFFQELKEQFSLSNLIKHPRQSFKLIFGKSLQLDRFQEILGKTQQDLEKLEPQNKQDALCYQEGLSFINRMQHLLGDLNRTGIGAAFQLGRDLSHFGKNTEERLRYFTENLINALAIVAGNNIEGEAYQRRLQQWYQLVQQNSQDPACMDMLLEMISSVVKDTSIPPKKTPVTLADWLNFLEKIVQGFNRTPMQKVLGQQLLVLLNEVIRQFPGKTQVDDAVPLFRKNLENIITEAAQKAHRQLPEDTQNREALLRELKDQYPSIRPDLREITMYSPLRDRLYFIQEAIDTVFLEDGLSLAAQSLGLSVNEKRNFTAENENANLLLRLDATDKGKSLYQYLIQEDMITVANIIIERMRCRPLMQKIAHWFLNAFRRLFFGERIAEYRLLALAKTALHEKFEDTNSKSEFVKKLSAIKRETRVSIFAREMVHHAFKKVHQLAQDRKILLEQQEEVATTSTAEITEKNKTTTRTIVDTFVIEEAQKLPPIPIQQAFMVAIPEPLVVAEEVYKSLSADRVQLVPFDNQPLVRNATEAVERLATNTGKAMVLMVSNALRLASEPYIADAVEVVLPALLQPVLSGDGLAPIAMRIEIAQRYLHSTAPSKAEEKLLGQKLSEALGAVTLLMNKVEDKSVARLALERVGPPSLLGAAAAGVATGMVAGPIGAVVGGLAGVIGGALWPALDEGSIQPTKVIYTELAPIIEPLFESFALIGGNDLRSQAFMVRRSEFLKQFKRMLRGEEAPLLLPLLLEVMSERVASINLETVPPAPTDLADWMNVLSKTLKNIKRSPYQVAVIQDLLHLIKGLFALIPKPGTKSDNPAILGEFFNGVLQNALMIADNQPEMIRAKMRLLTEKPSIGQTEMSLETLSTQLVAAEIARTDRAYQCILLQQQNQQVHTQIRVPAKDASLGERLGLLWLVLEESLMADALNLAEAGLGSPLLVTDHFTIVGNNVKLSSENVETTRVAQNKAQEFQEDYNKMAAFYIADQRRYEELMQLPDPGETFSKTLVFSGPLGLFVGGQWMRIVPSLKEELEAKKKTVLGAGAFLGLPRGTVDFTLEDADERFKEINRDLLERMEKLAEIMQVAEDYQEKLDRIKGLVQKIQRYAAQEAYIFEEYEAFLAKEAPHVNDIFHPNEKFRLFGEYIQEQNLNISVSVAGIEILEQLAQQARQAVKNAQAETKKNKDILVGRKKQAMVLFEDYQKIASAYQRERNAYLKEMETLEKLVLDREETHGDLPELSALLAFTKELRDRRLELIFGEQFKKARANNQSYFSWIDPGAGDEIPSVSMHPQVPLTEQALAHFENDIEMLRQQIHPGLADIHQELEAVRKAIEAIPSNEFPMSGLGHRLNGTREWASGWLHWGTFGALGTKTVVSQSERDAFIRATFQNKIDAIQKCLEAEKKALKEKKQWSSVQGREQVPMVDQAQAMRFHNERLERAQGKGSTETLEKRPGFDSSLRA